MPGPKREIAAKCGNCRALNIRVRSIPVERMQCAGGDAQWWTRRACRLWVLFHRAQLMEKTA